MLCSADGDDAWFGFCVGARSVLVLVDAGSVAMPIWVGTRVGGLGPLTVGVSETHWA